MNGKIPWFERTFSFDLPVERYPEVIERLRGTPERVDERVRSFPPEILQRREGDTWSIQENVGHLLDLEPLWAGRLDDILARADVMREADLTNRKTYEAGHNSTPIGLLTASFREARAKLVARLENLEESTFALSARHPRLQQPMRLVDLCLFVAEHDDYHLARITELAG